MNLVDDCHCGPLTLCCALCVQNGASGEAVASKGSNSGSATSAASGSSNATPASV